MAITPATWAPGIYPGATKTIVEVVIDDGIVGLGEVHGAVASRLIDDEIAPRLVGENPLDRHRCRRRAVPPLETVAATDSQAPALTAFGAIELALWDIAGKFHDVPVHELLGGAVRGEVAFSEYFSARVPTGPVEGERGAVEIANYCERMVEEHDSPVFEGKVGYDRPSADVALVREVRAAIGPERALRLDANMGWDLATARSITRRLSDFDVANIEDPVGSFYEMAKLRAHTAIPFSTHAADLRTAVALGTPDTFVLNLTALGGIEPTLAFVHACTRMGHGFWFYSGDTGIGTAAYLQVSAATPELVYPHQSLLRWQADDVVSTGVFRPTPVTSRFRAVRDWAWSSIEWRCAEVSGGSKSRDRSIRSASTVTACIGSSRVTGRAVVIRSRRNQVGIPLPSLRSHGPWRDDRTKRPPPPLARAPSQGAAQAPRAEPQQRRRSDRALDLVSQPRRTGRDRHLA